METKDFAENIAIAASRNIKERDYWLKKLSGELVKSHFAYDYKAKPSTNEATETATFSVKFSFPTELAAKLSTVSQHSDYTLHMILLAGLTGLLNKLTGSHDIILGSAIYKQEVAGNYINSALAFRNAVDDNMTFKQLLMQVKQVIIEATENQNYPIETLIYQLHLPTNEKDFPLFDIAVLLENIHDKAYLRHIHINMFFNFLRTGEHIDGEIIYNPSMFKQCTVEVIAQSYLTLMQNFLLKANAPISEIEIIGDSEKTQILQQFNQTDMEVPKEKVLHQLFEEQVEKTPDAIALVFDDRQITYKQLNEHANRLARQLRALGVQPDGVVGLMADILIETIIGMTAILKAGGAFLPIDSDNPVKRIEYLIKDSGLKVLLTALPLEGDYETTCNCKVLHIDLTQDFLFTGDSSNLTLVSRPENLAYVIYTSGSTGNPKGVMLEHRNIVNQIYGLRQMFFTGVSYNHILLAPFTFDPSVQHVYSPLTYGAKLIMVLKETKMDSMALLETIVTKQVEIFDAVPSQLNVYLDFVSHFKPMHFEYIILAGEVFSKELFEKIKRSVSVKNVINIYGPTEATINSTYYLCPLQAEYVTIPIGKPLMNYKIVVLNKQLNLLPVGVAGELFISGAGIARGYFNAPNQTSEKFLPSPFFPGERMYATGDMAMWLANGNLEFVGREDHQVKIRGFRVELQEIEKLLSHYPGVKEVVVIDREKHIETKDGDKEVDKYLCAYFVSSDDSLDAQALREFLAQHLPDYMIPDYFVKLDKIPLTAHDKLDRRNLPEPELSADTYTPPRNKLEERLVQVWADLLEIDANKIGIDTNFFSIGGHSLKATALISKTQQAFNVKIPLVEIFKTPTIRELAQYIASATETKYVAIKVAEKKQYYPLSSVQQRLYFIQQVDLNNIAYNIPQVVPLSQEADFNTLERIFKALINRHESFRTSFHVVDNVVMQMIHDDVEFVIPYYKEGEVDIEEKFRAFVRPFDLTRAPLLRVELIEKASGRYLLIDMHHIISDGISFEILVRDFTLLLAGKTLPPLPIQYKDYAVWQQSNANNEDDPIKKQETFWRKQFEVEPTVLNLPLDFPRPAIWSFEGNSIKFSLGKAETKRLNDIAASQGATMFMVLLAVFNVLMARLSSQDDIVIGTPIAGRRHEDLQEIIGMFVNTLALRNYPAGEKEFSLFLNEVKNNTLAAFENQEYHFEDLLEILSVKRDRSRNPLFNVMLVLQNQANLSNIELIQDFPEGQGLNEFEENVAKFDLTINSVEVGGGLMFVLQYSTNLFQMSTIERFRDIFLRIISAVITNPCQKIADIEIISAQEKEQILHEFNNTAQTFGIPRTLDSMFAEQVAKNPDNIALVGMVEDSRWLTSITYQELNRRAEFIAGKLLTQGVVPGSIVGIMLEPFLDSVWGILGILKAGCAYLPIHPGAPVQRIKYMIADSAIKNLVTSPKLAERLTGIEPHVSVLFTEGQTSSPLDATRSQVVTTGTDLAYVIYTSGTTGKPKAVAINHQGIVNYITSRISAYRIDKRDVTLQLLSYIFDGFYSNFYCSLLAGAKMVLVPEAERLNLDFITRTIAAQNITNLVLVPGLYEGIINTIAKEDFKNIRFVMLGGEQASESLIKKSHEKNPSLFHTIEYGPTEASVAVTANIDTEPLDTAIIGKPLANTHVYIVDQYGKLVPVGIPGEITVSGIGVGRGYLNQPLLTAERFVTNTFNSFMEPANPNHTTIYRTGDIGRWMPDGKIRFLGRIDEQVKIRGFRIELKEIETQLLTYGKIKETVVLVKDSEQGDKYLVAYFVADTAVGRDELQAYLAMTLPEYMIPAHFIQIDNIPLTPNGKIDRRALPEPDLTTSEDKFIGPRNEIERKLVELWSEVLKLDKEKISIDSSFFELGGHSLKLTALIAKITHSFHIKMSVVEVFKRPTIRQIAEYIHGASTASMISNSQNVVLLRLEKEDSPNLFFIHDGSGEVDGYIEFCNRLKLPFNCWGIRDDRFDEYAPRELSISMVAEKYVTILETLQPQGPYSLIGWSLGGTLAFEMARLLEVRGKQIHFLSLIDTVAPRSNHANENQEAFTIESELKVVSLYITETDILEKLKKTTDIKKFWQLVVAYLMKKSATDKNILNNIRNMIIHEGNFMVPNYEYLGIEQLIRYFNIARTFQKAWATYIPPHNIQTPIHFFHPTLGSETNEADFWATYVDKPILLHQVTGDHYSIFTVPHVHDFVALFQKIVK